jgi:hypothetical protein
MPDIEQLKSAAISKLLKAGYKNFEFEGFAYHDGIPTQPFLKHEKPCYVFHFRNLNFPKNVVIDDGDSYYVVKVYEHSMACEILKFM